MYRKAGSPALNARLETFVSFSEEEMWVFISDQTVAEYERIHSPGRVNLERNWGIERA